PTRAVEDIGRESGGGVVWTPLSSSALMTAAEERDVTFAGADGGGYIFTDFLAAHDSVFSLAKLLELLARTQWSLSTVVDRLPQTHVVQREVDTPWEAKGTVMRRLLERAGPDDVTLDGLKTYRGRDWAAVAPHPEEPVVRVWAEADSEEAAGALADEYAALVEELKG